MRRTIEGTSEWLAEPCPVPARLGLRLVEGLAQRGGAALRTCDAELVRHFRRRVCDWFRRRGNMRSSPLLKVSRANRSAPGNAVAMPIAPFSMLVAADCATSLAVSHQDEPYPPGASCTCTS